MSTAGGEPDEAGNYKLTQRQVNLMARYFHTVLNQLTFEWGATVDEHTRMIHNVSMATMTRETVNDLTGGKDGLAADHADWDPNGEF